MNPCLGTLVKLQKTKEKERGVEERDKNHLTIKKSQVVIKKNRESLYISLNKFPLKETPNNFP